jgi:hypothetical protein
MAGRDRKVRAQLCAVITAVVLNIAFLAFVMGFGCGDDDCPRFSNKYIAVPHLIAVAFIGFCAAVELYKSKPGIFSSLYQEAEIKERYKARLALLEEERSARLTIIESLKERLKNAEKNPDRVAQLEKNLEDAKKSGNKASIDRESGFLELYGLGFIQKSLDEAQVQEGAIDRRKTDAENSKTADLQRLRKRAVWHVFSTCFIASLTYSMVAVITKGSTFPSWTLIGCSLLLSCGNLLKVCTGETVEADPEN